MVLIVILTISLLGAALAALFFDVVVTSRTELARARALYLAEAGIAKAINLLRTEAGAKGLSSGSQQIIPPMLLGEGSFEVYCDYQQSTIISIGVVGGVRRVIQVKYNAF